MSFPRYKAKRYNMAKETKKQIKAQLTNELSRKFDERVKDIKASAKRLQDEYLEIQKSNLDLVKKNKELTDENLELKEKIAQYEEWVERMQDFCNLPDHDRQYAFKTYLSEIESKAKANETLNTLGRMFNNYFSILL